MQVAKGGEGGVVKRNGHVGASEDGETDTEHEHERAALREVGARKTGTPKGGDSAGGDDECWLGDKQEPGGAFCIDKRRPAGGAAQDFYRAQPGGGHGGRLDEICKRWRVAAQHKQRPDPPG